MQCVLKALCCGGTVTCVEDGSPTTVEERGRAFRAYRMREIFIDLLYAERDNFISLFRKRLGSVAALVDRSSADAYISLHRIIRSYHQSFKQKCNLSGDISSLYEPLDVVDSFAFTTSNKIGALYKSEVARAIYDHEASVKAFYNREIIHLEKYIETLVTEDPEHILMKMEVDPHTYHIKFFSLYDDDTMAGEIDSIYVNPIVWCMYSDLDNLQLRVSCYLSNTNKFFSQGSFNRPISRISLEDVTG